MIHVLAVVTTHPGKRAEVLAAAADNRPAVLAEDGCIEYNAVVDSVAQHPKGPKYGEDTFVVIEKWASPEHLKAHAASAHMKAYGEKVKDLLAKRDIYLMDDATGA